MMLFARIAWVFFKIGLLTIGGGLAMLPIVQHEIVSRGWLSNAQFLEILGIAEMTPGPMAVNTATFTGYRIASAAGGHSLAYAAAAALVGTLSVCAPSFICINALGAFWQRCRKRPCMICVFKVLRPLVTGLVIVASATLALNSVWGDRFAEVLQHAPNWQALGVLLLSFGLSAWTRISPIWLLAGGMLIGIALF